MKFQLDNLIEEHKNLETQLSDPSVYSDQKKMKDLIIKKKNLDSVVELYIKYKKINSDLTDAKDLLKTESDEEMKDMLKMEIHELEDQIPSLEEKIQLELLPKDPADSKNVMLEVRAGTGGDEAALFAGELAESYMIFAKSEGFSTEVIDEAKNDVGGTKEIVIKVKGEWAYSRFKFESGTHRVQRIPTTESKGRVHTSAVTVAILPEADEIDVEIRDEDLDISTTRASGAGGQHVNKTESAIRMVHIPTWVTVECQDQRSQLKNKNKALEILRSRVYALEIEKQQKELSSARLAQVGSGDRSEKIRTYNFPQDRVTDHRIGQNFSNLPGIMTGTLGHIIDALAAEDQARKLAQASWEKTD